MYQMPEMPLKFSDQTLFERAKLHGGCFCALRAGREAFLALLRTEGVRGGRRQRVFY
jgi:hypothetical protein